MGRSVDDLQVGHAPEVEQLGPRALAMVAPDRKQRHPVVDLGVLAEALAGQAAAALLQALEPVEMVARRGPQFPGGDAAAVPGRVFVGAAVVPQIAVPAEPKNRLAAHAAMAGTLGVRRLTIGRGRGAEARRQA